MGQQGHGTVDGEGADASPAERVIARFGGQSALARALGANASTVQHWAKTGNIPPWRHAEVERVARERGIVLTDGPVPPPAPAPPAAPPAGTSAGGGPLPHGRADPATVPTTDVEALRAELARLREAVTRLTEEVTRLREGS